MSAYGIPYKGGKSKIVKWVCECLPPNEHFYDLFCGGCSVTHYAMLSHRWKYFHINDLNGMMPQMFIDAAHGKFANEKRWISREDFFRLRETDGYVAVCFSFGNDLRSYAYAPEVEIGKKAAHMAIMFGDYSYLKELFADIDFTEIERHRRLRDRYSTYRRLIRQVVSRPDVSHLENLSRLLSLERLQSLQSCKGDYQDVEILPNSTVYCDIPYRGTNRYQQGGFDHDRFYEWADSRDFPVFISEYDMPNEFEPIAIKQHQATINADRPKTVCEKMFVQKRFAQLYKRDLFV